MTRSRTIRIALGLAAGLFVLLAAVAGGALRPADSTDVASDGDTAREASTDQPSDGADADRENLETGDEVLAQVDTADPDAPDSATDDGAETDGAETDADAADPDETEGADSDPGLDDVVGDGSGDDAGSEEDAGDDDSDTAADAGDGSGTANDAAETGETDGANSDGAAASSDGASAASGDSAANQAATIPNNVTTEAPAAVSPAPLLTPTCALDRLIIYAGAQRSGIGGSLRDALPQLGFGAECAQSVTVLAANCPLQFDGVLGAGSGYDPLRAYVAASPAVSNASLSAVLDAVVDDGAAIDTLDFSYATPDKAGEQWIAVFIPPSFDSWQGLASAAGVQPTDQSMCSASGRVG